MYTDHNPVLTKRPPPMSPPMSQTWTEIWSVSRRWASGKNSSRLEIMQTKAEGSRIRPTRRAHFPVQHMSFCAFTSLLLLSPWWYFLLSTQGEQGVSTKLVKPKNKRDEWDSSRHTAKVKQSRWQWQREGEREQRPCELTPDLCVFSWASTTGMKKKNNWGQASVCVCQTPFDIQLSADDTSECLFYLWPFYKHTKGLSLQDSVIKAVSTTDN